MRAIVIASFGGPEVLQLRDVPKPVPSRGEVLVRVRATAINRADILQRMGAYPPPADAPQDIPGLEFAGEVEALGEHVAASGDAAVGDRVAGLAGGGTYAEYLVVPARTLTKIPDGLSFTDAAALPEAFITAYDAMVSQAHLAAGEVALVHAVGSGVGTAAVQIIRAVGAQSIGTSRTEDKLGRARELGLDHGVLTPDRKFADKVLSLTGGRGVDVVLDLVGGAYIAEDLACIAPRGRIAVVSVAGGALAEVPLGILMRRRATIFGTVLRARPLEEKIAACRVFTQHLMPLVARGVLKASVDRILPLAQAAEAHDYVGKDTSFGKVVLEI